MGVDGVESFGIYDRPRERRPPISIDLRELANPARIAPYIQALSRQTGKNQQGVAWAKAVPYIDAHAVAAILDDVVGPENWRLEHVTSPVAPGLRQVKVHKNVPRWEGPQGQRQKIDNWMDVPEWVCHARLTITLPDGREVYREAVGTNDNATTQTGAKGADSDALKRTAQRFGIGAILATIGESFIRGNENFDIGSDGRIYRMLDDGPGVKGQVENWRRMLLEAGTPVSASRPVAPVPAAAPSSGQEWHDDPGPEAGYADAAAADDAWAAGANQSGQGFPPPSPYQGPAPAAGVTGQWSPLFADRDDAPDGVSANDRWAAVLAYAGGNSELASQWLATAGVEKTGGLRYGNLWRRVLDAAGISQAMAA